MRPEPKYQIGDWIEGKNGIFQVEFCEWKNFGAISTLQVLGDRINNTLPARVIEGWFYKGANQRWTEEKILQAAPSPKSAVLGGVSKLDEQPKPDSAVLGGKNNEITVNGGEG
jgi:hypothetical protein